MAGVLDEFKTYRMRPAARAILENPTLAPTALVRAGKFNFYMGPLLQVNGVGGERPYVLALVPEFERGEMCLKRRFYYKSDSGGDWRVSSYKDGWYLNKGIGRHYTAETQPADEILNHLHFLESQGNPISMTEAQIFPYIDIRSPLHDAAAKKSVLGGFRERIRFGENEDLVEIQQHRPGEVFQYWLNRIDPE